jgi:hypothetical protein
MYIRNSSLFQMPRFFVPLTAAWDQTVKGWQQQAAVSLQIILIQNWELHVSVLKVLEGQTVPKESTIQSLASISTKTVLFPKILQTQQKKQNFAVVSLIGMEITATKLVQTGVVMVRLVTIIKQGDVIVS